MIWRSLFANKEIISKRDMRSTLAELSFLNNLVTHGSSPFVLKSKPHQVVPFLKTTQNDPLWKNQFFFVRRDCFPGGEDLPAHGFQRVGYLILLFDLNSDE